MAKPKKDNTALAELKKALSSGEPGQLYLFCGEETYLRDHYLARLREKLIPEGMEAFNHHRLEGKDFDLKTLGQLLDCLPMMSERTLVEVWDYDVYKGDRDGLAALFSDLPEYVCLVFIYDLIEYKADARTRLAAAIGEHGAVVSFNRQEQGDLVDWIARHLRSMGKEISSEDARYLIFLCGDLMTTLGSEVEKVGSYARGRRVTREDIDAVATPQLDAVVFQMTDAIAAGDFDRAASVLGDLFHLQQEPIYLLAALGKQMRQLYTARLALERHKGTAYVMELWGMRSSYPAEKLMSAASRFSLRWCRKAVSRCAETDLAMKSGGGASGEELLTGLLLELSTMER